MISSKNNSILFLTTLGVYLGLVLVGGSGPQALAHGALTRSFELQDEIEAKDDLDTKPDSDSAVVDIVDVPPAGASAVDEGNRGSGTVELTAFFDLCDIGTAIQASFGAVPLPAGAATLLPEPALRIYSKTPAHLHHPSSLYADQVLTVTHLPRGSL